MRVSSGCGQYAARGRAPEVVLDREGVDAPALKGPRVHDEELRALDVHGGVVQHGHVRIVPGEQLVRRDRGHADPGQGEG